jgi:acyl-CoA synthetase (AMP-forming)/AMP-acid ligase II
MFTVGGRNVYPAEIESALSAHSDVLSCLVVGVPDDDLGHVPYALVQAATSLTAEALHAFLAERLSAYKALRTIEFVDRPCATTSLRDWASTRDLRTLTLAHRACTCTNRGGAGSGVSVTELSSGVGS